MADKFLSIDQVAAGTTSVSVFFELADTTTGAPTTGKVAVDMTGSFWRQGSTRTAITLADLAAVDSAYSAGGVKEVDGTNMKGLYRLDLPDSALAAGADWVVASILVTGCMASNVKIALPTYATFRNTLFAKVVESEGSYTVAQALSVILAATAGVTATGGTVLKTPNGVSTRITATVNPSNERTAMTITPSS